MAGGDLKRDLGLPATTAIAIGAMVGSGIFILPGLAFMTIGGGHESVIMAFLLSAILVLPAALSASEMATAMPESGGSYIYVERGMGPLMGTIAGIGNWFMLSFKGALALIGGVPYLVYVLPQIQDIHVPVFGDPVIPLALLLAMVFIGINLVSASGAGSLQFYIVALMVLTMGWFVVDGLLGIDTNLHGDLAGEAIMVGYGGLDFIAATALVFISYAGVIKIAAVAEEVKDPGRIIPRAMIGSLIITTLMYVAIVYVAIAVIEQEFGGVASLVEQGEGMDPSEAYAEGLLDASGEGPIMAIAADATLGWIGVIAVTIAALMALASTANAGLLSGSRFPFAMARDNLAPQAFAKVSERFNTPTIAVGVTGGMMLFMIAFLPIETVAKAGSAFQIIVFILVNLALIGFREGATDDYNPVFKSPLYPWTQLFGILGGLIVLTQIGVIEFAGAVIIVGASVAYYYLYARDQLEDDEPGRSEMQTADVTAVDRTRRLFESREEYDVLVALTQRTSGNARDTMLRLATDLGRIRSALVSVVDFYDEPRRLFGERHPTIEEGLPDWVPDDPDERPDWMPEVDDEDMRTSGGEPVQEAKSSDNEGGFSQQFGAHIQHRTLHSNDHKQAIVDFATYEDSDLLVIERQEQSLGDRFLGSETEWIMDNAPCDVVLVEDRDFEDADEIAVVATHGLYDPLKLLIADAFAEETGASLHLLQAVPTDLKASERETLKRYHSELKSILTVEMTCDLIETDNGSDELTKRANQHDLLVTSASVDKSEGAIGVSGHSLADSVDCTTILVQPHEAEHKTFLQHILMDYIFGAGK